MPSRFTLALTSCVVISNLLLSAAAGIPPVGSEASMASNGMPSAMTLSSMQMPSHYSSPVPTANPLSEQACLKGPHPIRSMPMARGARFWLPPSEARVGCFNSYYQLPSGEDLVVASVDAATNITQSISQLIQNCTGRNFLFIVPIVISDLRTLTATVATGIAHIAVATRKDSFTSDTLAYALRGFVTVSQNVADGLIGKKGFFSQYPSLTPLRTTLLALQTVYNKFILLVANLVSKMKIPMAMTLQSQMDQAFNHLLEAFPN